MLENKWIIQKIFTRLSYQTDLWNKPGIGVLCEIVFISWILYFMLTCIEIKPVKVWGFYQMTKL